MHARLPRTRRASENTSARSQFAALVRKNFTLKTRGILCCCTGVEIILPCFFLALLCLPKALVDDSRNNDVFAKPYQLATSWDDVDCVSGYTLVVSPDSADAQEIAEKAYVNLVCDAARSQWPDATPYATAFLYQRVFCQDNLQTMSTRDPVALATLGGMFGSALGLSDDDTSETGDADMDLSALCADACLRDSACYAAGIGAVARVFTKAFADATDASAYVALNPGASLAQVQFKSGVSGSSDDPSGTSSVVDYVLTVNSTAYGTDDEDAELTRERFARRWGTEADSNYWKKSAHVLRVTNAVESAVIDTKDGGVDFSANVDVSVRPYPWLGYDYNIGGIIAAGVFAIIGTLAFISNVVIIMKSVVVEKELRLREGMQMMGMSSNMYWASWFFTHWITGMCTVVLLVIIGTYPFEYTNPVMQLIFYTLWITSCILWNYMISCAFSKSITASVVGCFVYVMSIAPAIAVRITQPNGGSAWLAVCLLPGSSINQWGDILARLELAKAGITFASAGENVNRDGTFTAWAVIGMTFLDCVLFAFATWYLDKTWPKEYGVRLQPWFLFTKKYWFPNAASPFSDVSDAGSVDVEESGETFEKLPPEALRNASVKIRGLKKTFDNGVVAVDDLSVTFVPGQVSALLGHNGAGKTTTISMLTGMLDATGGDAFINNRSIKTDMPAIRASLGICPQFDVLWPMMTVREHLTLYAAFGGMKSEETKRAVVDAVAEVALLEKLDVPTGNLSGGQKRKLSLAIAFVTRPDVVFLDEPTSGMDPYSRRFTWEVIRRRAATSSIMLTTHFLDEADLLCDRIAIMSAGKLACVGSPLFLKNRYGTGYTLTLARASSNPNGGADAILSVVKSHLPGAVVTSDVGAELAVMLPSEGSGKFASLFKELDGAIKSAGFASYGISCTTLEEVFLSIARGGVGGGAASRRMSLDGKNAKMVDDGAVDGDSADGTPLMDDDHDAIAEADEDLRRGYVKGRALLARQARGLLWKRYLNWRRDAWSVLIQIVVPVLFFVLALVLAGLDYSEDTDFVPIDVSRANLLGNTPTVTSADSSDAGVADVLSRWPEMDIQIQPTHAPSLGCECNCPQVDQPPVFFPAECCAYDFEAANVSMHASIEDGGFDSNGDSDSDGDGDDDENYASKIFAVYSWCQAAVVPTYPKGAQCASTPRLGMDVAPACLANADDSFDAYLWQSSEGQGTVCKDQKTVFCDAMRVESYSVDPVSGTGKYAHELYAHQTAYHSLWATSQSANAAILRARVNDDAADFASRVEWFPKLETYEDGDIVNQPNDSTFITSLFVVMGAAVLTSSVVVFPVYERRNNSKHLQMVSGVDKAVYWLCHWFADLVQMCGPMAAIMIIFAAFDIEQYRGELGGVFVLLLCFVCSSITYTHLLGFYFNNEFYAFVGLVGAKMFLGLVSASAGMVVQAIKDLNDDTKIANDALSKLLPLIIPHYSFGKGLYDIGQNKLNGARLAFDAATMTVRPVGRKDWWDKDVVGDDIGFLVGLGVFYGLVILFAEVFEGRVSSITARLGALDPYALVSKNARETARALREEEDARDAAAEDEDVAAERARVREMSLSGFDPTTRDGVILESLSKTFGGGAKAKRAVRDVSVGMPRGQCFGLLGINGAGKTSTFRMITGEFAPTFGDTKVLSTSGGKREYVSVGAELSRARRAMGYCPQFDGLQPNMTGREHLQFYAQVRGVPDDRVNAVVDALIDKMALRKYCEKQAGTYSGGNKRKLSVAIALVGEPSVVLLDEPSTGMDPEARRFMWDVISASTRGRTIVLTSHSMEECEALCNRIGIMVGGRFSCLGSLQHLKNRFSEGYSIDLRFQPGRGAAVADAVAAANLPGLEIVETHPTELKLRAKHEGTALWRLFDVVEKLRNAPAPPVAAVVNVSSENDGEATGYPSNDAPVAGGSLVDEYSVSQTTLEQVFVRFASKQNEETGAAPGLPGGYQGAMMDDAPPPRKKPGCCFQVCCCGCCCP